MKKIACQAIGIVMILLFYHCKKSASGGALPPETQQGANTFGCLVNGQVWVAHFPCGYMTNPCAQMVYEILPAGSGKLPVSIHLNTGNNAGQHTYFSIASLGSAGGTAAAIARPGNIIDSLQISFNGSDDAYGSSYTYYLIPGSGTRSGGANNFTITKLDTSKNIFSGTFGFTLYANTNTGALDSVVITEGRFDLQLGQYCTCSH